MFNFNMKIMIGLVLLFSLLTISLAANVNVYGAFDYFNKGSVAPAIASQRPFKFAYHSRDKIFIYIFIKIKSANVTLHNVTYSTDQETIELEKHHSTIGDYYYIDESVTSADIKIKLNINKFEVLCSSCVVAEGSATVNEGLLPYEQICQTWCTLEVDLRSECDDFVLPPPQNFVLILNVSASVVVICIIILVMYLSIEKFRHRNSDQVDAIELNTYATVNDDDDVVYADLSLAHGDS